MKYILILVTALTVFSCQSTTPTEKEQVLETMDKASAREVVLSTKTVGDTVYHISSQKIWAKGQILAEKIDTLKTAVKLPDWNAATDSAQLLNKVPIYVTIQ